MGYYLFVGNHHHYILAFRDISMSISKLDKANKALKRKREGKQEEVNLIDFNLPHTSRMELYNLTSKVLKILHKYGLHVTFVFGNLLGVVRSCLDVITDWSEFLSFIPYDDDVDLMCISPISKILVVPWNEYKLEVTLLSGAHCAVFSLHRYSSKLRQWPFIEFYTPRSKDAKMLQSCSSKVIKLYPRPERCLNIHLPSLAFAKEWLSIEYGDKCLKQAIVFKPHLPIHKANGKLKKYYEKSIFDNKTGALISYLRK